jgi:CheY-like chemotaxis protein
MPPNSTKKRLNMHISKYFRIVSPTSHADRWDAKVLTNLHLYSPATSGLLDMELVGRESIVSSLSQRLSDDNLLATAARLILRGRFHEITGNSPPPRSDVIYEHDDVEGNENSEGSGKQDEVSYAYLFLMYPCEPDAARDDSSSFAHIVAASASAPVRSASGDAGDTVARLLAANAALMAENERLKAEAKSQDMRGMIGNVAHDLKTPLAAFMGGVDLISDMAQECSTVLAVDYQQLLQQQAEIDRASPRLRGEVEHRMKLASGLRTILRNITQQAAGVKDINQFMTMTINRCIDYTKASQGIKLVPRNETIHLTEVLAMPINCMIASQSKVAFRLQSPPADICTHIITDKIWLQENILCLLSNAAKYSNAGHVDIQISLFPAQSLAGVAAAAAAMLKESTSTGSHKAEQRTPTESIIGSLSPKQVCIIHHQRCERAAAAAAANAAGAGPGGAGHSQHSRDGRRRPSRSGSMNPSSRRSSASSAVSSSSKVLSPVVAPLRQTICVVPEAGSEASADGGQAMRPVGLAPVLIPTSLMMSGHAGETRKEDARPSLPRSPLGGTSGKMESRPRACTLTDPLSQPSASWDEALYSSGSTSNTPTSTPASTPKGQLSPLNHYGVHSSAIAHGALSPTHHNIAAATANSHRPAPAPGGYVSGPLGSSSGAGKGHAGTFTGGSPAQSHPHSRVHSQSNSRDNSHAHSRSHSADVDAPAQHSASVSSPIGYLRHKMSKAVGKLRGHKHRSFDSADDAGSLATSTVHDDIEAMALRGSFSSDGEGDGDDLRPSLYSDAPSSRQVSTDSRQFSSDSRGFRFSSMDLSMGNLDEDEEESAKTVLSQHHLLYPPQTSVVPISYSPSSISFLTGISNCVSNTPVEVFPQHGGGLLMNKPIHKLHSARNDSPVAEYVRDTPVPAPQVTPLLLIEISDTGIGLTESNMNKLFSPFMQAQRLAGGTGLGLYSLSKRLDALGGHYGVESRKDGLPGSLFWFAIPYREDTDAGTNFNKLQRSGSSRLEDLILSAQPSLAELMASSDAPAGGTLPGGIASTGIAEEEGDDSPDKTNSAKSVSDPEPQAESAPHVHALQSSSLSSNTMVTASTRTSQGSIPPLSPTARRHASYDAAQSGNDSPFDMPRASPAPPLIGAGARPMHILLVDDSESILKVTSMLLTRLGHSVDRAENGVVALNKLAQSVLPGARAYDVVVMDLQMPVLDGLEATKRLREIEDEHLQAAEDAAPAGTEGKHSEGDSGPKRQVVIGLSANGDEDTMAAAYTAGVDCFIEKPFTIQKLLDALTDIQAEHQN